MSEVTAKNTLSELKKATFFSFVLFMYFIIITLFDMTVIPLDQYYMRNHLPWAAEDTELSNAGKWNAYNTRDGDALFEYAFDIQETLKNTPEQNTVNTFSSSILLGYPLGPEWGHPHFIAIPIARIFLKLFPGDFLRSACYAANLTAGILGSLIFITLWMISYYLFDPRWYLNLLAGFAGNFMLMMTNTVNEPSLAVFFGVLLILLGLVIQVKSGRQLRFSGLILCFAGSLILYNGKVMQYYVYVPLLYAVASYYLCSSISLRYYFIYGAAIFLGLVCNFASIYDTIDFLNISNKATYFHTPIEQRYYGFIPVNFFIDITKAGKLFEMIHLPNLLPHYNIHFGLATLIFTIFSLKRIRRSLLFVALFIVLYWTGPLQYILSITIGGPFRTESSIQIHYMLYLFLLFASIYSIHTKLFSKYVNNKWVLTLISSAVLLYLLQIALAILLSGRFWFAGFIGLLCSIVLFVFFRYYSRLSQHYQNGLLLAAFLLFPFSNGFLYSGAQSLKPNPVARGYVKNEVVLQHLNGKDVGAAIIDTRNDKDFHPNFWYNYNVRSIHAYRTPVHKKYAQLYWYQHYSNDPSKTGALTSLATLNQSIRINWLRNIIMDGDSLTRRTKRFYDLAGVNLIAASNLITHLNISGLSTFYSLPGVTLWRRTLPYSPFRIVGKSVFIQDEFERITTLLENETFDPENVVIVLSEHHEMDVDETARVADYRLMHDGVTEVDIVNGSGGGILTTNLVFYPGRFEAFIVEDTAPLEIIDTNHCFIGIPLPENLRSDSYTIRITYRRPDAWKNIGNFVNLIGF